MLEPLKIFRTNLFPWQVSFAHYWKNTLSYILSISLVQRHDLGHPDVMALKISLKNTCLIPFWGILGFQSCRMLCDLADFVHMSGTIEVLLTPACVQILVMGMLHNHWSGKNKLMTKGRHNTSSSLVIFFVRTETQGFNGQSCWTSLKWRLDLLVLSIMPYTRYIYVFSTSLI